MNISKMVDKRNGRTQDTYKPFAEYLRSKREEKGLTKSQIDKILGTNTAYSWWEGRLDGIQLPTKQFYFKLKKLLGLDNRFDELIEREEAEREVIGTQIKARAENQNFALPTQGAETKYIEIDQTVSATPEAKILDGSYGGFQPKPAVEIVIVCMKPLSEKTFVDQALANKKGVMWLDDARIPFESTDAIIAKNPHTQHKEEATYEDYHKRGNSSYELPKGRFPANLLVSVDALNDGQEHETHKGQYDNSNASSMFGIGTGVFNKERVVAQENQSGSFSRYFDLDKWFNEKLKLLPESVRRTFPFLIVPKASKSERNQGLEDLGWRDGAHVNASGRRYGGANRENWKDPYKRPKVRNDHPTVKPLKLMSYLVTLGSREGDVVLDPFVGSGTTCIAAKMLGRKGIGIDINPEYCEISRKRIATIPEKLDKFMVTEIMNLQKGD
jgi:transcriptional regulator with XRE-family HTH domain